MKLIVMLLDENTDPPLGPHAQMLNSSRITSFFSVCVSVCVNITMFVLFKHEYSGLSLLSGVSHLELKQLKHGNSFVTN